MISVVMPAHNEEGYLEPAVKAVITHLRERGDGFEVIIAENGSTDSTRAECSELESIYPEVTALHCEVADYGRALRAGFESARGEIVVNLDVDLVDVAFVDRALSVLADENVAMVLGSKRGTGSEDQRAMSRRFVTAAFWVVLRFGFDLRVSDTHGLKALRRAALGGLVAQCQFGADIFDTELILRAERAGLCIRETPVSVAEKRPPRTSIATRIPRTLLGLARLRMALWSSRFTPGRP